MKKNKIELFEYCPVCGHFFGSEEFDFQECDSCGWPDSDKDYDNDDSIFDDDFDEREDFYFNEIR